MEKKILNYASPSLETLELMLEGSILTESNNEGGGTAGGELGGESGWGF